MVITPKVAVGKIDAYLHHGLSIDELVAWAESAMMEDEFDEPQFDVVRDVVARLGLADVRAFGLTWDDCEQLLRRLGYRAEVRISAA